MKKLTLTLRAAFFVCSALYAQVSIADLEERAADDMVPSNIGSGNSPKGETGVGLGPILQGGNAPHTPAPIQDNELTLKNHSCGILFEKPVTCV